MEKIEYKIGSKKKELTIIELGWQDFCKSTDLAIKIDNPNGSQFTDIANLVMLYTGKKDQDMMEWKNSCKDRASFINEVGGAFSAIVDHIQSKKK